LRGMPDSFEKIELLKNAFTAQWEQLITMAEKV
jgi:hypothetical protein